MRFAKKEWYQEVFTRLKQVNWKKIGLFAGGGVSLLLLLLQLFYPSDRMLPFSSIDGVATSWQKKTDVIETLDAKYAEHTVAIYMGTGDKPVVSPSLKAMDVSVNTAEQVNDRTYPWYLRIIPTSLFWAGIGSSDDAAARFGSKFGAYVEKSLMPQCKQEPVNASLKANGALLEVVPAVTGGTCQKDDVTASLKKISPSLTSETSVRVARDETKPAVDDKTAKAFADELTGRLNDGVSLTVIDSSVTVPASDVYAWLDFGADGSAMTVAVNADRAGEWLSKNVAGKVAIAPGVSYVKTLDFTELSRVNGSEGRAIAIAPTIAGIQAVVRGEADTASVQTQSVPPTEQYTRTYSSSDAGLSALLENYAKDHKGTFGATLVELDGKKRRASYNGDKQFVTASTYKLFVAYSLLKQIDAGKRDWDSNAACFNKMISYSDNACAESFLNSLGLSTVTKDIQAIGLKNSNFTAAGGPFTTANDLSLLLGMIATGQNFSATNQQRLLSAMRANVYRSGIPAGANGTVADKVGFMNGLLHDAAIVYGPNGTYVLAIMTDGSSWATIADLAKQIDTLHAQ